MTDQNQTPSEPSPPPAGSVPSGETEVGKAMPAYTMQTLVWDGYVIRFRENAIVRFLLDAGDIDLNDLAIMPFSIEDREQFAQLIGYSVSGFGDLSYARDEVVAAADQLAEAMWNERHGWTVEAADSRNRD